MVKNGSRISSGMVTGDPLESLAIGDTLSYVPLPPVGDIPKGIANINNWDWFEGALLCLNFLDGDFQRIEGSAVMVAPGIALCATHVLSDHMPSIMNSNTSLYCVGIAKHGLDFWAVRTVTQVGITDVSILGLSLRSKLPPENRFYMAPITTRLPRLEEELNICGFRAAHGQFARESGTEIGGELYISNGVVEERYPDGRDKVLLPGPALQVDCPALGGMSGGPVFDKSGHLVGLLSSSVEGEGISFVSLLWPALVSKIKSEWPPGLIKDGSTLLSLAERKVCFIEKPEAIKVLSADSDQQTFEYMIW